MLRAVATVGWVTAALTTVWAFSAQQRLARYRRAAGAALKTSTEHAAVVTKQRGELAEELDRRVNRDSLTALANRESFQAEVDRLLQDGRQVAVLFIDLDDFKTVNDTLGHAVGDELLVCVAERLVAATRAGDLVARLGGDEFAVACADQVPADALRVAQRVLGQMRTPFRLRGRTISVRGSGGLSVSDPGKVGDDVEDALELLRQADLAMYASKTDRTHSVTLFHDDLQTDMMERLSLESEMHRGIAGQDFYLHYQPVVDIASGCTVGFEALMRWQNATRGVVAPSAFVPVAEQTGMIVPLTIWAIREACSQLRRWDEIPGMEAMTIAVNLSARFVREPGIGSAVARELHRAAVAPDRVVFEITESLLMDERSAAVQTLCHLRALGARLSIDDFGTGYSSLSRLTQLPIDEVKIDRSFVDQVDSDHGARAVVEASIAMAHGLGLHIVAEGVETTGQLEALRALGCDQAQGYLFGRPSPAEDIAQLFTARSARAAAAIIPIPRRDGLRPMTSASG